MVIHWILILIVWGGTGVATTTANFLDQQSCEQAGRAAQKAKSWGTVDFACAPQSKI